jgi:hypothetical protein
VNNYDEEELVEIKNLINTVFYLDQDFDNDNFLEKLETAFQIVGKLARDQQNDFLEWFEGVFFAKANRRSLKSKSIQELMDSYKTALMRGDETNMTYAIERYLNGRMEKAFDNGLDNGGMLKLIEQIDKKHAKNKSRDQIIDELELDEAGIDLLDNLETYRQKLAGGTAKKNDR